MISFLLVLLGLLLVLCEFYLPGAIMGILGGISITLGLILFVSEHTSLLAIIAFIIGTAAAIWLVIRFAMWRIVNSKTNNSIYLNTDQEGYQASEYDKSVIGKMAIVVADLKPRGYILVDNHHYPAISLAGYISKGESVTIVGGQEQSLMVTKTPTNIK